MQIYFFTPFWFSWANGAVSPKHDDQIKEEKVSMHLFYILTNKQQPNQGTTKKTPTNSDRARHLHINREKTPLPAITDNVI